MSNPIDSAPPAAARSHGALRPAQRPSWLRAIAVWVPLIAAAPALAQQPGGDVSQPEAQPQGAPDAVAPLQTTPAAPDQVQGAPGTAGAVDEGASLVELAQSLREGEGPLSADQVAAMAVKTAPSIRRAQAASDQARSAASEALVAVFPRVELEARYTRINDRTTVIDLPGPAPDFVASQPLDQYLLEARASFPVSDVLLQIIPRYRSAQEAAQAQELTAQAEAATVALQAQEAFYNYARARAALLVARSSQAQSEAQRRDVAALVAAGTLARVEAMRADAQVAAAKVAVARAEGAVAVARTALRTLLHRPGDQDIAVTERFGEQLPALAESKDELLSRALRARKEVAALRTIIKSHELRAQAEGANRFPKLGVGGRFDYAKPNQEIPSFGDERDWEDSWAVIGTVTWSPNDFAAAGARVGQAEADRAQALADLQSLEDALRQEVAAAYEDYLASRQAMDAATTGILAAEESYRVRREQFRAGAAVATDVIDAEAELRRARLELINAAIDVRIARARLDRAVGGGQHG